MVEPLLGDFLPRAFLHRLFDKITGNVRKKSVYPYAYFILILLFKLPLAVNGPAHQPTGILAADDSSGDYLTAPWITLADIRDVRDDLIVQGGNRRRFPVGLSHIRAEFLRMPKGGILLCNIFPQTPAAAGADFRIPIGRMVLITVDRAFRTAPVGDKHKVIFRKHDPLFHTLHLTFYGLGNLLSAFKFKDYIGHFRVKPEINSCRFQIPLHRQYQ